LPIDDAGLGLRTRQIRLTAFSLGYIGYHIAATMVWGKCIAYAIAAELGSQFHNIGKDVSPARNSSAIIGGGSRSSIPQ
jgi:hypothetical protein